jgi:peptide deformylase
VEKSDPRLKELIVNMYETMYSASGVGLAAPQVGVSLRLFITDGAPFGKEEVKSFKRIFINPEIKSETGKEWEFNEGCLSIPDIREDVTRQEKILVSYYDEHFHYREEYFSGFAARIIQHEYDHLEGILFTDRVSALRKRLLKKKLEEISKGNVEVDYKMRFPVKR